MSSTFRLPIHPSLSYLNLLFEYSTRRTYAFKTRNIRTKIDLDSFEPPLTLVSVNKFCRFLQAGGNSVWSEVLSMEMLSMLYSAKLEKTEMELQYVMEGSITDYSVKMNGFVIGVSVTRAMKYRGVFSYEDALALLTKKMKGVMKSSENISEEHKWTKQVLHVWVQEPYMVALVEQAYAALTELHSNTLVQLTVCGENLGWIFK